MNRKLIDPIDCLSTHGMAGYAPGSYWDGDVIVCGACGYRIKNPYPTGGRFVQDKGILGWLFGKGKIVHRYGPAGEKPEDK